MQPKTDVAFPFAETALARRYGDLSEATVAATQAALTDTLGCALAGTNAPGVGEARAGFGRQWPGGTVTIWGGFGKAMGPMAAVMNAASLHALDYDDTDDKVPLHANSVLLPALVAYMEERGIACDGKAFLTALAVGIDGAMRIGRAGGPKARKGWNYSVISGGIGTILALGHLGKWDTETTVNALGHQLAQTSGSLQSIIDGSLAKRFQPAMLAKDTLFAAALAEAGVDGPRNVFEGRAGFWALYQDGEWDRDVMLTGMESCSMVTDLSLKPYPTCRFTHACIDVGIEMHRQGLRPENIKRLRIMPSGQAVNMTGRDFDHTKAGVVDAQFSVAYSTSVALAQGAMKIDDITIERIRQSPVGAFVAEKVVVEANPEVDFLSMSPVVVEAELASGEIRRFDGPDVSGSPEKPLTREQLFDKVADCLGSNDAAVSAEELMASVDTLPGAASMAPVMDLLARPSARAEQSAVA